MVSEEKIQELLFRLDERSKNIKSDIEDLKNGLEDMKEATKRDLEKYVTKEQFAPMQRAIYSVATFIVVSVLGLLISFFKAGH